VVGTRSALLAPLPPPATLVLVDEHDAAHKPPGAPRMHSRDILVERAGLEGSRLLLLSATPSVESWWHADSRRFRLDDAGPGPWPQVIAADTRGVLRHHPLTLPLTRAIEEMARRGRPTALIVTREAAGLGCEECGAALRCPDCGVALALSRVRQSLSCRLCSRCDPLPSVCPRCGGRRLSPFGWGVERVEASVRRRFPRLSVGRAGGARPNAGAEVVVGTAALLRGRAPGSLGCVGFIALDGLLRIPDFRAGERAFAALWAAAEAVGPDGRVIAQTLHPEHHAVRAVTDQSRPAFYAPELRFRAELGYPPFRRLCLVSVLGRDAEDGRRLASQCQGRLAGIPGLTVYQAAPRGTPGARRPLWRFAVKGPAELPALLAGPLSPLLGGRRRGSGMVEVEMDPLSLA
jgi:primosomal protein N' (replication factor Y)